MLLPGADCYWLLLLLPAACCSCLLLLATAGCCWLPPAAAGCCWLLLTRYGSSGINGCTTQHVLIALTLKRISRTEMELYKRFMTV